MGTISYNSMLRVFIITDVHSPDGFSIPQITPDNYDLVLTLGDISQRTMEYIFLQIHNVPSFGVLGNHDPQVIHGLHNVHCTRVNLRGITLGGFGGAPKYKDAPNHYTEREASRMMRRMKKVDLFISHSPPLITSRDEDLLHQGFSAFDRYLYRVKPRVWIHGHLGRTYETTIDETVVYGVAEKQSLVLDL